jgi:hypothetical protein
MDTVPSALAQAEVLDAHGQPHKMSELWKERTAVVHFVRHFG